MTDTASTRKPPEVSVKKYILGEDVSRLGAFPISSTVVFEITAESGVSSARIELARGSEKTFEPTVTFPMMSLDDDGGSIRFSQPLALGMLASELAPECTSYLLRCRFVLTLSDGTEYFTDSVNNVDFTLSDSADVTPFRILCYEDGFTVPEGFGGVMYQIFPDRFSDGGRKFPVRDDAVLNEDWYGGITEYAEYPGAFVKNNVFFGGNLVGIAEKLDYLSSLGVTMLYLNPIFEAYSNHKYDTGDYMKVDAMFGGDEALAELIEKAHSAGIKIILDGVFNHTGDNSVYFNRYGKYGSVGAYQSENSPYHDWYIFGEFPDKYESWWGIDILPKLNQTNESCRAFFTGKGGVCEKYIRMGIDGWRLDVADELPEVFLDELRRRVKAANRDALIIGEVWENAADKVAYGKLRNYLGGGQLDSVMNYPFRNAALAFVLHGDDETLYNTLTEIYASYPPAVCGVLMNLLGTHDTSRILTELSDEDLSGLSNAELSHHKMSDGAKRLAVKRLKLASILQYTVYGFPSVYYGDEAGVEGGHDPFCRTPYPWGLEDSELLEHYKALGKMRKERACLQGGDFETVYHGHGTYIFKRTDKKSGEELYVAANASENDFVFDFGGVFGGNIAKYTFTDALTEEALDLSENAAVTVGAVSAKAVYVVRKG